MNLLKIKNKCIFFFSICINNVQFTPYSPTYLDACANACHRTRVARRQNEIK